MEAFAILRCKEGQTLQSTCDIGARLDQDDNKYCGISLGSVSTVRPKAAPSAAAALNTQRAPLAYVRSPRASRVGFRVGKLHFPRHAGSSTLLGSSKLHAVELKIAGPHLCDLPQDFASRLHGFLTETLGMEPLHVAVGQGCIHLVLMLLEMSRGTGLVGLSSQRRRRRCISTTNVDSLSARLMAFMLEMLPDGSAGTSEHAVVRANQQSYQLNLHPTQGQVHREGSHGGPETSPGPRLQPRARSYAANTVADDDSETCDMAVSAKRTGTYPAGSGNVVAKGAETVRTSAPASTFAGASLAESSGGTWGSSGVGPQTRSWVAWPLSPGAGVHASNGGSSHMNSGLGVVVVGTSQGTSGITSGVVGPSQTLSGCTDGQVGEGVQPSGLPTGQPTLQPALHTMAARQGAVLREAEAPPSSTIPPAPQYFPASHQRGQQFQRPRPAGTGVMVISGKATAAVPQRPGQAGSGSRGIVTKRLPQPELTRSWVSGRAQEGDMEIVDLLQECEGCTHSIRTNAQQLEVANYTSWARVNPTASGESLDPEIREKKILAEAAPPVEAATETDGDGPVTSTGLDRCGSADIGSRRESDTLSPFEVVDVVAATKGGGVNSGEDRDRQVAWQQTALGGAMSGGTSAVGGDGGRGSEFGNLTFSQATCGPTLADCLVPLGRTNAVEWTGPSYPPAMRTLSPTRAASTSPSLNPGHQQPVAPASANGTNANIKWNVVVVRPGGGGGGGCTGVLSGIAGCPSSGVSVRSMLGGGSVEIPEALARLLMPQVPLAMARLRRQSHAQAVELLSPAVAVWPPPFAVPPPPPPAQQQASSPEVIGAGASFVDQARGTGRVRAGVSRPPPLQQAMQPLATAATAAPSTAELCIVMRCPDVIASSSSSKGRPRRYGGKARNSTSTNREPQGSLKQRFSEARHGSGGSGTGSSGDAATTRDDGSADSLWNVTGRRDSGGSGASSSCLGQVSQLVAWNRSGIIPLRQLDDSAEGWTRATLLLPLPAPPPSLSVAPEFQPLPSPGAGHDWERLRIANNTNAVQSSSEMLLGLASGGGACCDCPNDGSNRVGGDSHKNGGYAEDRCLERVPRWTLLEARTEAQFPRGMGRDSAGGGSVISVATGVTVPPAAQLLYVAWRRGQSLGSPCPLLLLPSSCEDVVSELQALQPPSGRPTQLPSYQAFLADMGTWLEALHASTSVSWSSSLASSGTAGGNGTGGGGGGGGCTGSRHRSNPSLQSSSGRLSGVGTGTGTGVGIASGSSVAIAASLAGSPAHGDPLTRRSSLGNSGGSPWRALAPPLRTMVSGSAWLAVALGANTPSAGQTPKPELEAEPTLSNILQRTEDLSPFYTAGALASGMPLLRTFAPERRGATAGPLHQQPPLAAAAAAVQSAPARPLSQGQPAPSVSTLLTASEDVVDDRITRIAEDVFALGCDLLAYSVARGAVATARLIMGLLLSLGSQAPYGASLGSGAAARTSTATAAASGAAAGASTTTSPARSVGSLGTGAVGLVVNKPQRVLGNIAGTETGGHAMRAALLRAALDTCRYSSASGHTLLHFAVLSQSAPMLRLLLETWPQEYGLPVSELNRLDKLGLPPVAYLRAAAPASEPPCVGVDGSEGATEFVMIAEPMLRALGPPLPGEDTEMAFVAAAVASAVEAGRWGLQAVMEGSSEIPSVAASGVRVLRGASTGSGAVTPGSSCGDVDCSSGAAAWEVPRVSSRRFSNRRGAGNRSGGGGDGSGDGDRSEGTRRSASGGRIPSAPAESEVARSNVFRRRVSQLAALTSASASAGGPPGRDNAGLYSVPYGIMVMDAPATDDIAATVAGSAPRRPAAQMELVQQSGDPARPLMRWALWAAVQMLLGSVQALMVLVFAIPRARDLSPSASLLSIPGSLLWLPAMCLSLTSCLSAAAALQQPARPQLLMFLPPGWRRALPPWLPAALTSMGRALACVMSLAAAIELPYGNQGSGGSSGNEGGGSSGGCGGLLMLMAGGRGMSGAEASMRMVLMTLAPTALEAAYVEPPVRAVMLASEYGLALLYVMLYDSVSAAVVWLAYAASNVVLGMAVVALMDLHARAAGAAAAAAAVDMDGDR